MTSLAQLLREEESLVTHCNCLESSLLGYQQELKKENITEIQREFYLNGILEAGEKMKRLEDLIYAKRKKFFTIYKPF
jgi:hypothetical protein